MENIELKKTQASWDSIAEGYDNYVTPNHDWSLIKKVLKRAGLRRGMTFFDVASGSGAVSIPAAQLGAEVVAIDISPTMIRMLKKRAKEEGLPNLVGQVMDGHILDFDNNSFDISGSQFGVMLFPDLPKGLREMVRVTKKEGCVVLITFGQPEKVEFLSYFLNALQIVVPDFTGLPMDPPPLPFQVSNPKVLKQRMIEAGLKEISIEGGVEKLYFQSGKDMWNWVTNSNPIAVGLIEDLTEKQKIEVQQTLEDMLRERSNGEAYAELTADLNIGIGRKK